MTFYLCVVAYRADDYIMSSLLELISDIRVKGAIYLCQPQCTNSLIQKLKAIESIVVICSSANIGYGKAVNILSQLAPPTVDYLIVSNADITLEPGFISKLSSVIARFDYPELIGPRIVDTSNSLSYLCKRNPTLLGLTIRYLRIDTYLEAARNYDHWYTMRDYDYNKAFACTYLSGCFMIVRLDAFLKVGGFDERFFLYLEDADLTRAISHFGRTLYIPDLTVTHRWERGPYKLFYLALINIHSFIIYSRKWGLCWL